MEIKLMAKFNKKSKNKEKGKETIRARQILTFLVSIQLIAINTSFVLANEIKDSQIARGTERLIADLTTWLMVLAPIVGGLLILYFFIRRSAADEMDQSVTRS